jgi:drug/metabolite transporter (DMT)-like permease
MASLRRKHLPPLESCRYSRPPPPIGPVLELWIPITILAALLQCVRTALQQKLKALLSTNGANFVRYLYGAPISLAMLGAILVAGTALPTPGVKFFLLTALAGLGQIVATSLLIYAFTLRNFTVGTAYSKTETVQTAIFATLLLAEPLNLWAWVGIGVSLFGVWVLSIRGDAKGLRNILLGWTQKSALVGIGAGAGFAVAAISIRAASLSLPEGDFVVRAILTLAVMNSLQVVMLGGWLAMRERDQLVRVVITWRSSAVVGVLSVLGSACWALAMTLENAAHVRALGQIELVFTYIASRWLLKEDPLWGEILGSVLVVAGVVLLLLRGG